MIVRSTYYAYTGRAKRRVSPDSPFAFRPYCLTMALVDTTPPSNGTPYIVVFAILALLFVLTSIKTYRATHAQSHYSESIVLAYLFPLCSIIFAIATATFSVAYSGRVFHSNDTPYLKFISVIQPCATPILLNVLYETCYLVHKRRSVNFCGLEFDQGQRVKILNSRTRSFVLRNFIRMISLVLLIMGIIANFTLVLPKNKEDYHPEDEDLVGRVGWWGLYPWVGQIHLLLALLPAMCLFVIAFFLSLVLWRYGTSYSMIVHSSIFNPWCSQLFGTIAMAIGQCFGENVYLITSHIGFLLLIWSVLSLMNEINKDLFATYDFEEFLKEVARTGNQISITNVVLRHTHRLNEDKEEAGVSVGVRGSVNGGDENGVAVVEARSVSPLASDGEDDKVAMHIVAEKGDATEEKADLPANSLNKGVDAEKGDTVEHDVDLMANCSNKDVDAEKEVTVEQKADLPINDSDKDDLETGAATAAGVAHVGEATNASDDPNSDDIKCP